MTRLLFSVCMVTVSLAAQRTWVVDWQNGPGTNFLDLPPALAASSHGDTVVVRGPGCCYTGGLQTNKGITLLGVGSPGLLSPSTPYDLAVVGLPAGQTFTMKGFGAGQFMPFPGFRLELTSCAGRVHLEDVLQPPVFFTGNTLTIQGCVDVTLLRCQFGPSNPVRVSQSVVAMTETRADGLSANEYYFHGSCYTNSQSGPALEAQDSVVTLAGGTFTGGADDTGGGPPCPYLPASPAIVQRNGIVLLTGDTMTSVVAGRSLSMPAILTHGGVLLLDPDVRLVPSGSGPQISGSSQVVNWNTPYLKGAGVPAQGLAPLDLFGRNGDVALLLASRPGDPLLVPSLGWFWLQPSAFPIGATVIGASQHWQVSLPVPPGTPDGMPFAFQAIALTGPGLVPALSNPLVLVLH